MVYWKVEVGGKEVAPREGQKEDAERIYNALVENKNVVLSEWPGFGKTLAVLVSIANYLSDVNPNGYVVIITPNKLSSKYWYTEAGDKFTIYKPNGSILKIAHLAGKSSFDCFLNDKVKANDPRIICNQTISFYEKIRNCKYYAPIIRNKDRFSMINDVTEVREYLSINGKAFVFRRSSGVCDYYNQFFSIPEADVVVMNISMFLQMFSMGTLPKPAVLVIDEFDVYGFNMIRSIKIDDALFDDLKKYAKDKKLMERIIALERTIMSAVSLGEKIDYKHVRDSAYAVLQLINAIMNIAYVDSLSGLSMALRSMLDGATYMAKRSEEGIDIVVNLSKMMSQIIQRSGRTIFISGTPIDMDDYATIMESTYGLVPDISQHVIVSSGVKPNYRVYVYTSNFIPTLALAMKFDEDPELCRQYNELLARLEKLLMSKYGIVKILIPSKKYGKKCFSSLIPQYMDGASPDAVNGFVNGDNKYLISARFTRSLSILKPGAILIPKMPIPDTESPEVKFFLKKGYSSYIHMLARAEIFHLVHRFLRSPNSEVIISSLDMRVLETLYYYKKIHGLSVSYINDDGSVEDFEL
ncbi:MAG: hypothetical protein JZD41_02380 [Thermoproteus sp.]|nr:hypothetical protein [Thermoproteus sp.]